MRRFLAILLSSIALFLAGGPATPLHAESYRVGVPDLDYSPLFTVEEGRFQGYARAVLEAFADTYGHHFDYRPLPPYRLMPAFIEGLLDFKFPDNPAWETDIRQARTIVLSAPLALARDVVAVRPDRLGRPADSLKTLGTLPGLTARGEWQEASSQRGLRLVPMASLNRLINHTLSGQLDGIQLDAAVLAFHLAVKRGIPDSLLPDDRHPPIRRPYHLATIRHPDVLKEFDRWMAVNEDLIDALRHRYGITGAP